MFLQNVLASVLREKNNKEPQPEEVAPLVERRRHIRVKTELPLGYSTADGKEHHGGMVADVSEGGLLVYLMENLIVGTLLKIEILFLKGLELNSINGTAKVVRSEHAPGENGREHRYGLQFESFRDGDFDKLKTLVMEAGQVYA